MPILTLNLRGQDLIKKKTIRLHETVDLKYFKLMHVTTNLSGADVDPSAGSEQRQLHARLSTILGTSLGGATPAAKNPFMYIFVYYMHIR